MVSVLDIVPTALAAAEVEIPAANARSLDGVDLTPYLASKRAGPPHAALYWRYGTQWAVRSGPYKLLRVRDEAPQLYDVQNDSGETRDLAADQGRSDLLKSMKARWDEWNAQLVPPAWSHPNNPPWW
jgi:arylsulfatase A-like enzyme